MALSPEDRSAGLAAAARVNRLELIAAAELVAARSAVRVVSAPAAGSVMVQLETPVGTFCLTEAIVTSCEVEVAEAVGWSAVLGWDDEASLAAAILDATPRDGDAIASAALAAEAAIRSIESAAVAATRVER